jgi:hypothetical protein
VPGAWLYQAVFKRSELRKTDALVLRTLPPLAPEKPPSRAQREREAKAYWDRLTLEQQAWALRKMGSNHGYCLVITQRLSHCVGTARLMGGTIEYSANLTGSSSDFRVAVNGGTGAFKGAEGQVTIHNLNSDGSLSRDVIDLIG